MTRILVHSLEGKVGDAIRLLHSAKQLHYESQDKNQIPIYMKKSEAIRIQGLSTDEEIISENIFGIITINYTYAIVFGIPDFIINFNSNSLIRLAWVAKLFEKYLPQEINHVFSPENSGFKPKKLSIFQFKRIDIHNLTSRNYWDQSESINKPKKQKILRILYFVRHHETEPWRNSNLRIYKDLKEVLKSFPNFCLSIAGLKNRTEYIKNGYPDYENYIEYQMYDRYKDQKEIYKTFDLAIGVNSASLDLASIAGIPVLRLCEFQGLDGHWGRKYNSFLSVKTHIGMIPNSDKNENWYDQITQKAFLKIVISLMQCLIIDPVSLAESRHLLVKNEDIIRMKSLKNLNKFKVG
ncbi:hypothetical protein ND861_18730 [Leptospira sp. 2 VSF19]|uniref:DUF354 domain-containing protein n=1 Tax=Leptospira soteropolitanensis TaxID=2950025 RepID=A0AAW5VHE3_9LEPT|nr:hypothetical protein [Leptospira soteropolitanensis]MCW7494695.1 hypothetical protein [Leptospira soteropolitanensis]MCW7502302.1 hypothetical protein [Leptospira soteropolitanensis]MCW7524524.1 hypothetical protein [Leptospira soteropolitanensis]MCW7528400.1 hypothetical protein [Leptospira soteropolitanensis]MCW7532254.1 hypothetical protein [Leptospira soteropolitanensis]